jgi:hypothetical protein
MSAWVIVLAVIGGIGVGIVLTVLLVNFVGRTILRGRMW